MHQDLRELLHTAEGQSRHVVVIFLDVRGFSSFAKIAESSDAAEFLKSIYTQILDDYFPNADFFKLTGDGMLVLYRYGRESLREVVDAAVATSVRLVEAFPTICDDDPMVNFEVPGGLGVGIARGAATSLTSGDRTLDYSGRPLNLAARLMDLARPAGVVLDDGLGLPLLSKDLAERFSAEAVYIKGLAEETPMTVHVLKDVVDVPDFNRQPIDRFVQFVEKPVTKNLSQLREHEYFRHELTHEPTNKKALNVHITTPTPTKSGGRSRTAMTTYTTRAEYAFVAKQHIARVNYAEIAKRLTDRGVKRTWPVELVIEYPIRPSMDGD